MPKDKIKYKEKLTDIVNKLNDKYLAFGLYAAGRGLDNISTALGVDKFGVSIEGNAICSYMMKTFGPHLGPALQEIGNFLLVVGVYKIFKKIESAPENVLPYAVGLLSIAYSINNFYIYFNY